MATDTGNLTSKQEGFSQSVHQGVPQGKAYGLNFDCENMSQNAIDVEASRLMDHPKVSLRIQELRETVTEAALWTRSEAFLAAKVNLTGAQEDRQWGAANGAVKLAAELSGLTQEPAQAEIHITKVTVVLSGAIEAIEAEVIELPPSLESPEDSEVP